MKLRRKSWLLWSLIYTHLKFNSSPLKSYRAPQKERIVFQVSISQGRANVSHLGIRKVIDSKVHWEWDYVSIQKGILPSFIHISYIYIYRHESLSLSMYTYTYIYIYIEVIPFKHTGCRSHEKKSTPQKLSPRVELSWMGSHRLIGSVVVTHIFVSFYPDPDLGKMFTQFDQHHIFQMGLKETTNTLIFFDFFYPFCSWICK